MYHQQIPRERRSNLEWRIALNDKCRNTQFRAEVRLACKQDPLFYINSFCHIQEPRRGKVFPFCTWPYQDEAILKITDFFFRSLRGENLEKDMIVEKSRDMGATWLFCTVLKWLTDFHSDLHFLLVSWKEEMVWCPGNMDALFSKILFLREHEPKWLSEAIIKEKQYRNARTSSVIDGAATSERTGVGGRYTAIFIDEFSRIREDKELLAGTADCSDCRFFNFTALGTTNKAYELAQRADIPRIRMHWRLHPDKSKGLYQFNKDTEKVEFLDQNPPPADYHFIRDGKLRSPWYDAECKRRGHNKAEIAQMIDMDYHGSEYGFFDANTVSDLIREFCCEPVWQGEVVFDPETMEIRHFQRSKNGWLKLWCPLDGKNRPPLDRRYVFGADIAMGIGETNSCLSAIDCKTGEKVLSVATPFMPPEKFADLTVAILKWFSVSGTSGPKLIWDDPGAGALFAKQVRARGYTHVYYRRNEKSDSKKITDTPGWYPTDDNKQVVFGDYRAGLASKAVVNRDEEAMKECLHIIVAPGGRIVHSRVQRDDDPSCAATNHGDRPTADALAYKLFKDSGGPAVSAAPVGPAPINSAAGRRAEHERREREEESLWGD